MKRFLMLLAGIMLVFTMIGCKKEDEILQIGFVGTLSGTYASVGVSEMYGAQLAVKEINDAGGINGMTVELVVRDDKADPVEAVTVDNELYDMGIRVIIGHSLSVVALEAVENANDKGMLLLSPSIGTEALTGIKDSLVRNVATVYSEAEYIAQEMLKTSPDKLLMIYNLDNEVLTTHHKAAFEDVLESSNYANHSTIMSFYSDSETDKASIEAELLNGNYDAIFIASSNIDAAAYVNYIKANNLDTVIHLTSWAGSGIIPLIETGDTDDVYSYTNFDPGSTLSTYLSFKNDYEETYGVDVDMLSVNSYDMVYVLKEAIESSDSTDVEDIIAAIIDIGNFSGVNGDFYIDEYGDTTREHIRQRIENNEYIVVE